MIFNILLIGCVLVFQTTNAVSVAEESSAIAIAEGFFQSNNNEIPKAVRLIFHDCWESGCDACIDTTSDGNSGLENIVNKLNGLMDPNWEMSTADFYALSAVTALKIASGGTRPSPPPGPPGGQGPPPGGGGPPGGGHGRNLKRRPKREPVNDGRFMPTLILKYGRPTTCLEATRELPNAHGDLDHVLDLFVDAGFSERQTVALIGGAHSLGGASNGNSGFQGTWSNPRNTFNDGMLRVLVNAGWRQVRNRGTGNYQWRGGRSFMLNTDMAMAFEIAPDDTGLDTSSCRRSSRSSQCDPAATRSIVAEYLADTTVFMEEFSSAFQFLMELGSDNLETASATV